MIRVLALLARGTRTIIDATFGCTGIGETTYTRDLLPALRRGMILLADRNFAARDLIVAVQVINCEITITTKAGHRNEVHRLIITILDPNIPATEIIRLYRQRWEIETSFLELKSTILGGRVLRAKTPGGHRHPSWSATGHKDPQERKCRKTGSVNSTGDGALTRHAVAWPDSRSPMRNAQQMIKISPPSATPLSRSVSSRSGSTSTTV